MAASIPLWLEEAGVALLAALGIKVGGAVISEEAKRREQDTDQAETDDAAGTASDTETKSCDKCPPDCGQQVPVNHYMSEISHEYQERITGFPRGIEWEWDGIDFDGFKSPECLLQEAKGDYDQFFDKNGLVKPYFQGFKVMADSAKRQSLPVNSNHPASLTYYFMTPLAYEYMSDRLAPFSIKSIYVP
jgi:hypothetical protein